ncbi:MAG TPA: alpha/beta hydrolase, partial [Candidatus Binatia bacterium]|nr:alpha/beta hydrolase [Candidatus Binatia bacterium]
KPESEFSLRDMADDVLAVCRDEGIARAVFAGCSVGSGIAMLIALDQPEIVDALILVGGNSRGGGHVAGRIAGYLNEMPGYLAKHICELVSPGFPTTGLGRWLLGLFIERAPLLSGKCIAQIFRAREDCDMSSRLPGLKKPALVINGEHDNSLKAGRETAGLIPGAHHALIPATGHACCIEDPDAFDRVVLPFLAKVR